MKKNILLICLVSLLISSCATSYTSLQVLKPAQFTVTQDIKTICVLNRAHLRRGRELMNMDDVADNQPLELDWQTSKTVINQFITDMTANSPRFTINPLSIDTISGTGNTNFPMPLPINTVAKICATDNAQGLVSLEAFEVRPKITYSQSGTTITCSAVYQTTLGWRFYDPKNGQMIDEYKYTYNRTFTGTGTTQVLAKKNLPATQKCLNEVLIPAANSYVARISPVYETVSRAFHKKGSPVIESGYLLTQKNDWKGAADIWLQEMANPDPKITGMASYNIAVSFEVLGNLNDALVWAKKAEGFKTKWAKRYVQTLNTRIAELNQVRAQMGN
jgi:hypothetical protein